MTIIFFILEFSSYLLAGDNHKAYRDLADSNAGLGPIIKVIASLSTGSSWSQRISYYAFPSIFVN